MRKAIHGMVVVLGCMGVVVTIVHMVGLVPPDVRNVAPGVEWFTTQADVYREHAWSSGTHVVLAGFFSVIGLLQFWSKIRAKSMILHRWMGRSFVLAAMIIGVSGIWMSIVMPFGGIVESCFGVTVGSAFLSQAYLGWHHARKRSFKKHQHAMMRCYALGMGVVTMRILDTLLFPLHLMSDRNLFALTLFLGAVVNVAFCEWLIRKSGPAPRRVSAAAPVA